MAREVGPGGWWRLAWRLQASTVTGKRHTVTTDYYLKLLGLDVAAETVVGNEMLRGISGGQRKRVTTAEMVVVCEHAVCCTVGGQHGQLFF
jgi:hypothetical protein